MMILVAYLPANNAYQFGGYAQFSVVEPLGGEAKAGHDLLAPDVHEMRVFTCQS
jgi:hypothetical protein